MAETVNLLDGRYRIDALLGEGAMGTVSRGLDTLLARPVAIKILKSAYGRDAESVERFYFEARMAARIVDAHVVAIYDIVSEGSTHAIVMECVDGPSLATVLTGGVLDETRAIAYARQIAAALCAAHAHELVHRDLKPANVLINGSGILKVTDFGLARAFGRSDLTIDSPGTLVGSVHYFSPEQAQGRALGPASDLYSLGIVLYECCFGTVPFTGDSAVAIALAHVQRPAPTVSDLERGMSPGLARIVARLLHKDPRERFASASDVAIALAALVGPSAAVGGTYTTDAPTLIGRVAGVPPNRLRRNVSVDGSPRPSPTARRSALRGRLAALASFVVAAIGAGVLRAGDAASRATRRLTSRARGLPLSARGLAIGLGLVALVALAFVVARPRAIAIADVRGISVDRARTSLVARGLHVATRSRADERARPGLVIEQNPRPGMTSTEGSTVTLTVSSGLPMLAVPNLIGASFAAAVARLGPVKLHVRYAAAYADAAANSVIEQIPSAGTRVREGSNAIVVISTGSMPRSPMTSGGDGGD